MGTIRFLLALCVVVTHAPKSKVVGILLFSGLTAVQCFYVISGFLITMVLNERPEYASLRNFYLSRYLRLWPAYIVVALLSLALRGGNWLTQLAAIVHWPGVVFLAFSNLTLFFQDWTLFLRPEDGHLVPTAAFGMWPGPQVTGFLLVPQCWSIGVELTFYLIAPFVCRRLSTIAALFVVGTISRLIVAKLHPPAWDPWVYRFSPSEMMLFAAGGLAYFIGRPIYQSRPRLAKVVCGLSVAAFVMIVFRNDVIAPRIGARFGAFSNSLFLIQWPFLLLMACCAAPLFYGSRSNRLDNFLGELSYPMYVGHILVAEVVLKWIPDNLKQGNLLQLALVFVFSIVLLKLVTQPVDAWRRRFGARQPHLAEPRVIERAVESSLYPDYHGSEAHRLSAASIAPLAISSASVDLCPVSNNHDLAVTAGAQPTGAQA